MMPEVEQEPHEQQFSALYMAKVLDKLRESDKTPQAAAAELQTALRKLHASQQEFVAKQAKQNLLDQLSQVEALEALQKVATIRKAQAEAGYDQEERELQSAVREREDALQLLERLADEVEQQKLKVVEHERSREAHESELAQLNEVWKELQKRNAHRKAAVQVATGVMITDEEDCARVLDQQTQSIQEMHQKQKELEDEKIDISTQVKRTKRTIENLSKQNDMRSKDAEVKQREQDYMTLQQMKQWYDHVRSILESISGLEITNVADDSLEVRVLKSHSVRLFCDPETTRLKRVQFLTPGVIAADLVDVAVSDNNIRYLLCEYRERVRDQCIHLSFWQTSVQQFLTRKRTINQPLAFSLFTHRFCQHALRALQCRWIRPCSCQSSSRSNRHSSAYRRRHRSTHCWCNGSNCRWRKLYVIRQYPLLLHRLSHHLGLHVVHFFLFSGQFALPHRSPISCGSLMIRTSLSKSSVLIMPKHLIKRVVIATHAQYMCLRWSMGSIHLDDLVIVIHVRPTSERVRVQVVLLEPVARGVEAALELADLRTDVGVLSVVNAMLPHGALDLRA